MSNFIWWKHGVIYHIYPRSYYDSNNDGIGDIRGIIQKLDYISELGVDAIWLSPVYKSPMKDFGYDVSDYREIDPVFGSNEDFMELLDACHSRGIKVIMDMILNHTSEEHPWFKESMSSKDNPKRDWYIWKSGRGRKKPTNWRTAFGGSAWEYDKNSKQYYLHSFLKEQPDLNWRNKELKNAFFNDIEYWLEKGVDGFRLDAINMIIKDKRLRNNNYISLLRNPNVSYNLNRPKSHNITEKLRRLLDKYESRMSVGEIYVFPPGNPAISASYQYKFKNQKSKDKNQNTLHLDKFKNQNGLHMTFDFSIMFRSWNAKKYFKCIQAWNSSIPKNGWPSNVLSNHDLNRSYNRLRTGINKPEKARVAAVLLLTLKGTPFIYYGEEIGMKNADIKRKDLKDPLGKRFWPFYKGRDGARTPMQWNSSDNAGFSAAFPWLPVNNDFEINNVEIQKKDDSSLLSIYKQLIGLRKQYVSLHSGEWIPYLEGEDGIIAYFRQTDNEKILVVLNFTSSKKKLDFVNDVNIQILFSTHKLLNELITYSEFSVFPYEASILLIERS